MSRSECLICLEELVLKGGQQLVTTPGCCGVFYHQDCLNNLISTGNNSCPNCRSLIPSVPLVNNNSQINLNPTVLSLPPAPVQTTFQKSIFSSNVFNAFRNFSTQTPNNVPPVRDLLMEEELLEENITPPQLKSEIIMKSESSESSREDVSQNPVVLLNISPEFTEISTDENNPLYAAVSIKHEGQKIDDIKRNKTALDIVCVIDTSGSMQDAGKLNFLKQAMSFVISQLTENDRLSIVDFNSRAGILNGIIKMNATNKLACNRRVEVLRANGGTDIYAGMQTGWSILSNRQTKNPTSCVFLLTDGQDSSNMDLKLALAKEMKAAGTSLFVFGFGADHDSAHLMSITNAAEGTFTYIETGNTVVDAFGGALGSQQGCSLKQVCIDIACESTGVTIEDARSGNYLITKHLDKRSISVTFSTLFPGENRDILIRLKVPASADATIVNDAYTLLSASGSFSTSESGDLPRVVIPSASCDVKRVPILAINPSVVRNVDIDVQLNRNDVSDAIQAALQSVDTNGDYETARTTVETSLQRLRISPAYTAQNKVVMALESDLEEAIRTVRNKKEYNSGGRAGMFEALSSNTNQRSVFSKAGKVSAYQSESSVMYQDAAKKSKS